ncbi:hypothetical protein AGMMS49525_15690 [Bacteroidia bacterium]|nr:hypothetical protein AGMMS49525_15690 [Bacteroidia bacterium]
MLKKNLLILVAVIGISSVVFAQQKKTTKSTAAQSKQTTAVVPQQEEQKSQKKVDANAPVKHEPKYYVYCELFGETAQKLFKISTAVVVKANFGQKRKATVVIGGSGGAGAGFGEYLTDENGEKIKFNSMIDALNYMGLQGWEFVQTYSTAVVGTKGLQLVWLLKKEITPEEKAQMEEDLKSEE